MRVDEEEEEAADVAIRSNVAGYLHDFGDDAVSEALLRQEMAYLAAQGDDAFADDLLSTGHSTNERYPRAELTPTAKSSFESHRGAEDAQYARSAASTPSRGRSAAKEDLYPPSPEVPSNPGSAELYRSPGPYSSHAALGRPASVGSSSLRRPSYMSAAQAGDAFLLYGSPSLAASPLRAASDPMAAKLATYDVPEAAAPFRSPVSSVGLQGRTYDPGRYSTTPQRLVRELDGTEMIQTTPSKASTTPSRWGKDGLRSPSDYNELGGMLDSLEMQSALLQGHLRQCAQQIYERRQGGGVGHHRNGGDLGSSGARDRQGVESAS